jgi:hypothetical protein
MRTIGPAIVITSAFAACEFPHGEAFHPDGNAGSGSIVPSGGAVTPADLDTSKLGPFTFATALLVNTDTGAIGEPPQGTSLRRAGTGVIDGIDFRHAKAGNGVGVFRFQRLTVAGTIRFVGSSAVAFVAGDGIEIENSGLLDVQGECAAQSAGPGGSLGGAANRPGDGTGGGSGGQSGGGGNDQGGGGGGYGSAGGSGAGPRPGGSAFGDERILVLIGGAGGGGGGGGNSGVGGGGGGAVQLVSDQAIAIRGSINAGGCGGKLGSDTSHGKGGGGAGGAILIEGRSVAIAGKLAANGGGAGDTVAGSNGLIGSTRASGGPNGGSGGAGSLGDGGNAIGVDAGGGGGVGRIRLNTVNDANLAIDAAAELSPIVTPNTRGPLAVQ